MVNLPSFGLDGQIVMVTGASSGLGLYFANLLAAACAEVVLAARSLDKLQATVDELHRAGHRAYAVAMDVSNKASVQCAFVEAEQLLGGRTIKLLVNNAGWCGRSFFLNVEEEEWDTVIDTSLKGSFLVAQEMSRRLVAIKQAGSIVNIASILGQRVTSAVSPYCAAKAGLIHFSPAMAL